jgi:hypothetical protein
VVGKTFLMAVWIEILWVYEMILVSGLDVV